MKPVNVKGFSEHYLIDEKGNVFSLKSDKFLKPFLRSGYKCVEFSNSKGYKFDIHRLLMLTFQYVEGCENLVVNHINGNKLDNRFDNMEWTTMRKNLIHALDTGLRKPQKGEDKPMSKLTEKDVKQILEELSTGVRQQKIAEKYGVSQNIISLIKRRVLWKHVVV